MASVRAHPGGMRVAVVDAGPLVPERHAGDRAMVDLLRGLATLGHEPTLFLESDAGVLEAIAANRPHLVIASRPAVTLRFASRLRPLGVPLVYFGHDLHYRRLAEQARWCGDVAPVTSQLMRKLEERCWELADLSVYPDPAEATCVSEFLGDDRGKYFPYYWIESRSPSDRRPVGPEVFFVGGAAHAPNRDGLHWFLQDVWPHATAALPGLRLTVCGSWTAEQLPAPVPDNARFVGPIAEGDMLALMDRCLVAIAPLRFGAGVKRKVVQYLAGGIPTITSPVGAQGLGPSVGAQDPFVLAESSAEWVAGLERLVNDAGLRCRLASAGRELVEARYSTDVFLAATADLIDDAVHALRGGNGQ